MKKQKKQIPVEADGDSVAAAEDEQQATPNASEAEDGAAPAPADAGHAKRPAASKNTGKSGKKQARKGDEKQAAADAGEQEIAALNNRLLRLQADFDNFRKRSLREKDELYRLANQDIMQELLPVLDHLDLALKAVADHGDDQAFVEGVKLVAEQLLSALGKFGMTPVDAAGEEFDPNLHEAISHLPSEDVVENRVIEQVRRGYQLGDRLLRPAQVVVSSGSASATGEETGEDTQPAEDLAGSEAQTGA
jgi:molecular chaperone GrpE